MWVAKDRNGKVHLFLTKPERRLYINSWRCKSCSEHLLIPKSMWGELGLENLKWEDEPVEVDIVFKVDIDSL